MIKEIRMFGISCDNCNEQYQDDYSGFIAMTRFSDIKDMAENAEWFEDGDKHYCPNCYRIDDNDELRIIKT